MRCHTSHPIVLAPGSGRLRQVGGREPVNRPVKMVGNPPEQFRQQFANVHSCLLVRSRSATIVEYLRAGNEAVECSIARVGEA